MTMASRFDITLSLHHTDESLAGTIEYGTDLFSAKHHAAIIAALSNIVGSDSDKPDAGDFQ